jgi:hypothetical protein
MDIIFAPIEDAIHHFEVRFSRIFEGAVSRFLAAQSQRD